ANVPFLTALTGALRRYPSFMWQATLHSGRLALHPASTAIKRYTSNFCIPKGRLLPLSDGYRSGYSRFCCNGVEHQF
ncbi:MAG: hypothetical protein K9J77_08285, partial [Rhodoferax sp.]|nr:hypothetical protein [Rhodoferax sp.]